MKRILNYLFLFAMIAMASCSDSDNAVTKVEFAKAVNVMLADAPIDVTLKLSSSATSNIAIPFTVSGTAEEGVEYTISSTSFSFAQGNSTSTVTLTPLNNFTADKEVVLTLGTLPAGYERGATASTVVTIESKELIIYSFATEKATLLDKYKVTINLTGQNSGTSFTATDEMKLPFTFTSESSAVAGVDFEVEGGVTEFTIEKGMNSASVIISSLDGELGDEKSFTMKIDNEAASSRFLQGNNAAIEIAVKGIMKLSSLLGRWEFVEIPELEELLMWVEDMDDDSDLVPYNNFGFFLDFVEEDGVFSIVPGDVPGDLSAFLRNSVIDYSAPFNTILNSTILSDYCTEEPFMWTMEDIQLTYFGLSKVNRAFSMTDVAEGASTIAMRINEDGNLEIHLRDYDMPPFMENWWGDRFDSDMFGFCYIFQRVDY